MTITEPQVQEFTQELNYDPQTGGDTGQAASDADPTQKDDLGNLDDDADLETESHHLGDIDDPNDTSLKDIDDTLDLGSLGANASSLGDGMSPSFNMNGNNVSTHTFRKTEWDVKKLENYVRMSFGDATPMENMQPALMNRYLKA